MARGFVSGLIWGSVVAIGGAAVLLVLPPTAPGPAEEIATERASPEQAAAPEPDIVADTQAIEAEGEAAATPEAEPEAAPESAPETSPQTEADAEPEADPDPVAETPQAIPSAPDDETEIASPATPASPTADDLDALETADTTPADVPTVGAAGALTEAVEPDTDTPAVAASSDATPTTAPTVAVPQQPESATRPAISTAPAQPTLASPVPAAPSVGPISSDPAQPATPDIAEGSSGFALGTPEAEETDAAETEPVADAAASGEGVTGDAMAETGPEPAPAEPAEAPTVPETGAAQDAETPSAEPRIAALPQIGTTDDAAEAIEPGEDVAEAAEPEAPATPAPGIGQRVVPLTERTAVAPAAETETDAAAAPAEDVSMPPILRYAAPFQNPEGKPLMGIVLIDDADAIGAEALATFPYPVSFAVNPADPEAAEKAARHRAAGFEVLALIDLPATASAADAETALEALLSNIDESIGVLEGTGDGIQGNRELSNQVTAILRDQGYGLITQNEGLNTVQKLAEREGVPSAFVFRDFDGAGQTPTVMRRFLDQAAFRAGQEGGVIMLGRVRPDTISALLLWGLQDRARSVALAPASAVLTAE